MPVSAQERVAAESAGSRWDRVRVNLVVPIGVIVAVAIVCIVLAVLTSAQRADEVAFNREQQLIRQAISDNGERILLQLESTAGTARATEGIRNAYDLQWVQRRVEWLRTYFNHDVVMVVDGSDQITFMDSPNSTETTRDEVRANIAGILDLLRGRDSQLPRHALSVIPTQDPLHPGRATALIQLFQNRPAIVAAVAVGSEADLRSGNARAPIVVSAKFIDSTMLREIGSDLQISNLHELKGATQPTGTELIELSDSSGDSIARFAWKPTTPGRQIVTSIAPFIAIALAGFALLVAQVMRYMRRTAEAIAAGESRLRHLALHDPVCGLPNRIYFSERLETTIREVRAGGPTAAVFYIDLDHFKDVNDTLGHHIGDALILNVTRRLSHIVRGNDLVARLGGDEFAIITACASDAHSLQTIATRIITAVCAPYSINAHNIIIGASIGIATIERPARDAADILRYADMALYRAKSEGRNRACIYDAAMDADLSNRKLLEGDLLRAIQNDGLAAVYQPIVNASGETVIGVEALARWAHPTMGDIPPVQFIPIAEHSGLIIELGEWMLRRACLEGRSWPGLTIAVNVSPLQFRRSDFVEIVERIVKETEFDPTRLELELTETTLLGNLESAELSMLRLKALGVRFALDDFGTGYSSLLYLRRFPFDKLKIDSSFVRSIEKAPDAAAIVHAVVSLGRGLGMKVTAEGVENAEQHLFLRAAGIHSMQGYRFGRPGPASEISNRLSSPENYHLDSPDQEVALAS
ncbi:MAG TPA: EAL domain-containing protein [Xanthobacteraceae bacterium]|nr:EAL domain-containing protein [Xanthobacteraceae bacterium]